MAYKNTEVNKVVAFKGSNKVTDNEQDFDPNFYIDYDNKGYIDVDFVLQKLHLNKEQRFILTSNLKRLKKQLEDEIEADDREFEAMEREYNARMEHYKTKIDELNYIKEQLDNGVAIEDLDGIEYFDGDFGSFGLSL